MQHYLKIINPGPPDTSNISNVNAISASSQNDQIGAYDDEGKSVEDLEAEVAQLKAEAQTDIWLTRSIQAFQGSQKAFSGGVQPRLENSLRAYNSQLTTNAQMYIEQSDGVTIRPKVKMIVQKDLAAVDAAFFKNADVVSIEPENANDKAEVISARINKQLVNYRFSKSINWKLKCLGAYKQCLIQGQVLAHIYWDMEEGPNGALKEKPAIDIIPLENVRIDRAADWSDVVNSTPYIIILKNMYIGDIKEKMRKGKFIEQNVVPSSLAENATIAQERTKDQDPYSQSQAAISDQTALVMMYVYRIEGQDWVWYTLNNTSMLTEPKPLEDEYFHGKRPFVIGYTDIEPGTPFPTSFIESLIPVYEEINIFANQIRRGVDQVINRKWRVSPAAGDALDPRALLTDEAIVFAGPQEIEPLSQGDLPQSAFVTTQTIDNDFNELAGNYNPVQSMTSRNQTDAFRTHQMLNVNANQLVETRISNFAMTFVEPVIRQVVLLEQYYETDETLIGLVGQQAGLFQRFHSGRTVWTPDSMKLLGLPPQGAGPQHFAAEGMPLPSLNSMGMPQQPGSVPTGTPPMPGMPPGQPGAQPQAPKPGSLPPGIDIDSLLKRELTVKVNVGLNVTDPQKKKTDFLSFIGTVLQLSGGNRFILDIKEVIQEMAGIYGYQDGSRFLNQQQDPVLLQLQMENQQLKMLLKTGMAKQQAHDAAHAQETRARIASNERIKAAELGIDAQELKQHAAETLLEHQQEMTKLASGSNQPAPMGTESLAGTTGQMSETA